jgi:hypothetical protein
MSQPIQLPFNAARVCEAIARIGYEPHTALMDLVDNAVTAGATDVRISLVLSPGKNLKNRNGVAMYQICDNGCGMDVAGITNAFALGSDGNYKQGSLSKYGMGLKSAGLSLGSTISIISKRNGQITDRFIFDKDAIAAANAFVMNSEPLTAEEQTRYKEILAGTSGTVVEIRGCEKVNHPSPNSTLEKLRDRLGVVYFSFLTNAKNTLALRTRAVKSDGPASEFELVKAKDMLFIDLPTIQNWDPDKYKFSEPCLVLSEIWKPVSRDGVDLPSIKIQAVAFPQRTLAGDKSPLSPAEKASIKVFDVSTANSGFFIYRNGRLIRWGDDVDGLVGKDDINLRIRLDLTDQHDDVLHVDVTKQRLEMDDEHRAMLEGTISKALGTAKQIRKLCQDRLNSDDDGEGRGFTASTSLVPEDDPQIASTAVVPPKTRDRQKKSAEEAAKVIETLEEELASSAVDAKEAAAEPHVFLKIRYSEKVAYGQFWQPFHDALNGTFVCINVSHPFYQQIISRSEANSSERLALEALIFSMGNAQNNVQHNMTDIDQEVLERIFKRLHKNVDNYLSEWTSNNPEV